MVKYNRLGGCKMKVDMRASDYREKAWDNLSGKWGVMALITLIESIVLSIVSMVVVGPLIVCGPIAVGVMGCALAVANGKAVKLEDMFSGFKNFLETFLLYLINSIFIFLWSLLLIIPGIIAELKYSMSYFIIKENPKIGSSEARKQSIEMMYGHKWQLFCLRFSFIGWILLSILTLGILFLWVIPYMRTAEAEFYNNLKANQ